MIILSEYAIGQRWVSNTEVDLGLGIVVELEGRRVTVHFPAVEQDRVYASKDAPLSRIIYKENQKIKDVSNKAWTIKGIQESNAVLFYQVIDEQGEESILPELDLDAAVQFSSPIDRMLSGQIDPLKCFSLRLETLKQRQQYESSESVGLIGPRVQLLPHQLYIAEQVASRLHPRVLLADEVGLGKTIEAGLIIHQQLMTGAAERVLILVPDSLLHQWLVEMLRRFNLAFSVLDEAICAELAHEQGNPFDTRQLVLAPLSLLTQYPQRFAQAQSADWDLVVVDEAHHLAWDLQQPSHEYACVEELARRCKGLLLLTATPEQLGVESHFARLRLLDPDRYYDFAEFIASEKAFHTVNDCVDSLLLLDEANPILPSALKAYLASEELAEIEAELALEAFDTAKNRAIDALLDRHGTGRVLFRNTRHQIQGFPRRMLHTYALDLPDSYQAPSMLEARLLPEQGFDDWLKQDSRVLWLIEQLKNDLKNQKVLLICAQAETAIELETYLNTRQGIRSAVFHEHLALIARDRAAAYFADLEEGAQLLICSEIGSEGRNFQFAHHIVMFDLPLNPDLLEQRIGRLDRIGQQKDIHIHVPYYAHSPQATLLAWYHQGLNAFEQTCAIGQAVYQQHEAALLSCLVEQNEEAIQSLILHSAEQAEALRAELQQGRDKLLELNSCRLPVAEQVIDRLVKAENRKPLEDYLEQVCDQLGIESEPYDSNAIVLKPSESMRCGLLPGLKDDGYTYTFSREVALSREDMGYLTWEHPTVQAAMEHILTSEHGNTAVATIKLNALKPGTLLLESVYKCQALADKKLGLYRFLPCAHVRKLVNLDGKSLGHILTTEKLQPLLKKIPFVKAQAIAKQAAEAITAMAKSAELLSTEDFIEIKETALAKMQQHQTYELNRLTYLKKLNNQIRPDEIDALTNQTTQLTLAIESASIVLDGLRLIIVVE